MTQYLKSTKTAFIDDLQEVLDKHGGLILISPVGAGFYLQDNKGNMFEIPDVVILSAKMLEVVK